MKLLIACMLCLCLTGCIAVTVDCRATNGASEASARVTAGYGEGSALAAVDDDQATATATRSASTVENLGMAGIGAVGGILMGGGL